MNKSGPVMGLIFGSRLSPHLGVTSERGTFRRWSINEVGLVAVRKVQLHWATPIATLPDIAEFLAFQRFRFGVLVAGRFLDGSSRSISAIQANVSADGCRHQATRAITRHGERVRWTEARKHSRPVRQLCKSYAGK